VKRRDLAQHGCTFLREGVNHTLYINRQAKKVSTIPRHNEINRDLARRRRHEDRATSGPAYPRLSSTPPSAGRKLIDLSEWDSSGKIHHSQLSTETG